MSGVEPDAQPRTATFRPGRGRLVPSVVGPVVLLGSVLLALALPAKFEVVDRVMLVVLGLGVAGLMWRYASIHAEPRAEGLWVRNLGAGRSVAWGEIETVRFSGGMAWPRLDLRDGDDVSVMAIQRADGWSSITETSRLADLLEHPPTSAEIEADDRRLSGLDDEPTD